MGKLLPSLIWNNSVGTDPKQECCATAQSSDRVLDCPDTFDNFNLFLPVKIQNTSKLSKTRSDDRAVHITVPLDMHRWCTDWHPCPIFGPHKIDLHRSLILKYYDFFTSPMKNQFNWINVSSRSDIPIFHSESNLPSECPDLIHRNLIKFPTVMGLAPWHVTLHLVFILLL